MLKHSNVVVSAKWSGKIATFLFTVAVILMLFPPIQQFAVILAWVAMASAFVALIDYALGFFKSVKKNEVE